MFNWIGSSARTYLGENWAMDCAQLKEKGNLSLKSCSLCAEALSYSIDYGA